MLGAESLDELGVGRLVAAGREDAQMRLSSGKKNNGKHMQVQLDTFIQSVRKGLSDKLNQIQKAVE